MIILMAAGAAVTGYATLTEEGNNTLLKPAMGMLSDIASDAFSALEKINTELVVCYDTNPETVSSKLPTSDIGLEHDLSDGEEDLSNIDFENCRATDYLRIIKEGKLELLMKFKGTFSGIRREEYPHTAVQAAVESGNPEVLEYVLSSGYNLERVQQRLLEIKDKPATLFYDPYVRLAQSVALGPHQFQEAVGKIFQNPILPNQYMELPIVPGQFREPLLKQGPEISNPYRMAEMLEKKKILPTGIGFEGKPVSPFFIALKARNLGMIYYFAYRTPNISFKDIDGTTMWSVLTDWNYNLGRYFYRFIVGDRDVDRVNGRSYYELDANQKDFVFHVLNKNAHHCLEHFLTEFHGSPNWVEIFDEVLAKKHPKMIEVLLRNK